MQHFEDGGEIQFSIHKSEHYTSATNPLWDWHAYDYRIKQQYIYPLYFEYIESNLHAVTGLDDKGMVVEFIGPTSGFVVKESENCRYKLEQYSSSWTSHTDTARWKQVEKPIEIQIEPEIDKVKIEKWLINKENEYSILEGNEIFFEGIKHIGWTKVKLLSSDTILTTEEDQS